MKLIRFVALLLAGFCVYVTGTRFVCYHPSWAINRPGDGKFTVDQIDPALCTHYIYAFAVLDENTYEIKVFDEQNDIANGGYAKFVALKQKNPNLKTMIAIGGWADSESNKYSLMVANINNIRKFVASVMTFLEKYQFDGLDLDWEYPYKQPSDKPGFARLVTELRSAFASTSNNYLLSAAVSVSSYIIDAGYDVVTMDSQLDFINLMSYDLHGSWEAQVDHHAPLYKRPWEESENLNVDFAVKYWMNLGMSAEKINMGIPLYGNSWNLNSTSTTPQSPAAGPGNAGLYTGQAGFLAYYEICMNIANGWSFVEDPDYNSGPYAVGLINPKTWVGYDDLKMVTIKSEYVLSTGLGGAMVWDISGDDFGNLCQQGNNPLMKAIHLTVVGETTTTTTTSTPPPTTTTRQTVATSPTVARTTMSSTANTRTTTPVVPMSPTTRNPYLDMTTTDSASRLQVSTFVLLVFTVLYSFVRV